MKTEGYDDARLYPKIEAPDFESEASVLRSWLSLVSRLSPVEATVLHVLLHHANTTRTEQSKMVGLSRAQFHVYRRRLFAKIPALSKTL